MLLMTLIIVAVLVSGFLLMSTEQLHHVNRAAVAMVCGVIVWVIYLLRGQEYVQLMHSGEYLEFLNGAASTSASLKTFVAEHVITRYIGEACSVILFLIATNTIVEVLHNNGVFDSLIDWLRMRNSRTFLWVISLLTFAISANVDNFTTVVLMMSIITQIVRNHHQRVIYACTIMIAACMGGCFTAIGDMTSVMLWVRGVITPSAYAAGLFLPAFSSTCVFNLLIAQKLHGRVELFSVLSRYNGDDSSLAAWQKVLLLVLGLAGVWFIPSFHVITKLPPCLGRRHYRYGRPERRSGHRRRRWCGCRLGVHLRGNGEGLRLPVERGRHARWRRHRVGLFGPHERRKRQVLRRNRHGRFHHGWRRAGRGRLGRGWHRFRRGQQDGR